LNPNDTLCISVADAQNCAIAKKQRSVLAERIVILDSNINYLNQAIAATNRTIAALQAKDENNKAIIVQLQEQKQIMADQRKVFEDEIKTLKTELKKERHKRFWTSVAGLAGVGIMAYLYIVK
jgi:septal ring factor EnvC (AmiA/AmiB activator)